MADNLLTDEQVFNGPGAQGPGVKLLTDDDVLGTGPIDTQTGAGFYDRMLASFKSTPQGAANFYATRYGAENVRLNDGAIEYRNPKNRQWTSADPSRLELGDLADLVGDLPEILGSIGAGVAAGGAALPTGPGAIAAGAAASAGGAVGGNAIKQAIGAAIPGDEGLTLSDRAWEAGKAGVLGGVSQGVAGALAAPVAKLATTGQVPKALAAYLYRSASQSAKPGTVAEAQAIEAAIPGLHLSPAQYFDDLGLQWAEKGVEAAPFSARLGSDLYEKNIGAAVQALNNTLDNVALGTGDAQAIGGAITNARDQFAKAAFSARSGQAAADFATIDQMVGHAPIVDPSNFRAVLEARKAKITLDNGDSLAPALAKELDAWIARTGRPMSASDLQKNLHLFGSSGYGKGVKLFDALHQGDEVSLNRALHKALLTDLDEAAAATSQNSAAGQLTRALQTARANYAKNSDAIERLEQSVVNRLVGNVGEDNYYKVGERFLRLNSDGDKMRVFAALRAANPERADLVARGVMEHVIEKSTVVPRGSSTNETVFSIQKFLQNLPKDEILDKMFGNRQITDQVKTIAAGMRRLNLKPFSGESPTAEKLINYKTLATIAGSLWNPMAGAAAIAGIIGTRRLARHLLTTEGRAALETILKPTGRQSPPVVRQALVYLLGTNATQQ